MAMKPGAILNQYSEQQVAFWIDGYYTIDLSRPETRTPDAAFLHAKQQCLDGIRRHLDEIEAMTQERFEEMKSRGI